MPSFRVQEWQEWWRNHGASQNKIGVSGFSGDNSDSNFYGAGSLAGAGRKCTDPGGEPAE